MFSLNNRIRRGVPIDKQSAEVVLRTILGDRLALMSSRAGVGSAEDAGGVAGLSMRMSTTSLASWSAAV